MPLRITALLVSALLTAGLDAQEPVFTSKVEAVRVDVLVTDREKGQTVLGLGANDFEISTTASPSKSISSASSRFR